MPDENKPKKEDRRVSFSEEPSSVSPPPEWKPEYEVESLVTEIENFVWALRNNDEENDKPLSSFSAKEKELEKIKTNLARKEIAGRAALSYDPKSNSIAFNMQSEKMKLICQHELLDNLMAQCDEKRKESLRKQQRALAAQATQPYSSKSNSSDDWQAIAGNWQGIINTLQTVIVSEKSIKAKPLAFQPTEAEKSAQCSSSAALPSEEIKNSSRTGNSTSSLPRYIPDSDVPPPIGKKIR